MAKQKQDTIYIGDIIHSVYSARVIIVIMTVLGLLAGLAMSIVSYTRSEMQSAFDIKTSIAVTSTTEDGLFTTRSNTPNSTDIHLAADMVDSVIYVLKGDNTLNSAIDFIHLIGVTPRDIRNHLTLKQYKDTQIIELTLNWTNSEEGIQILEAINQVAPQILIDSLKIGSVTVVNAPTSDYSVSKGISIKMWVMMAGLGMMAGIGIAVLKMLVFPSVLNARSIEENFELEILGEIPYSKTYFKKKIPQDHMRIDYADLAVVERFKSLAHILQHRLSNQKPVCLYVTSAVPNEGKTSVVANMAVQLAAIENKVLLIDLDIHNPSLGSLFLTKVDYYHSLNAVYRHEVGFDDAIVHVKACLDMLPTFLESEPLKLNDEIFDIIKSVSPRYDYVLIDASPVGCSADMMILNRVAQTAVFVIHQDTTYMSSVNAALERLKKSGTPIVGAVLNAATSLTYSPDYRYYRKSNKTMSTE